MQMSGGWEGIKVDRCMERFCGLPSKSMLCRLHKASVKEGTKKLTRRGTIDVHYKFTWNCKEMQTVAKRYEKEGL